MPIFCAGEAVDGQNGSTSAPQHVAPTTMQTAKSPSASAPAAPPAQSSPAAAAPEQEPALVPSPPRPSKYRHEWLQMPVRALHRHNLACRQWCALHRSQNACIYAV